MQLGTTACQGHVAAKARRAVEVCGLGLRVDSFIFSEFIYIRTVFFLRLKSKMADGIAV